MDTSSPSSCWGPVLGLWPWASGMTGRGPTTECSYASWERWLSPACRCLGPYLYPVVSPVDTEATPHPHVLGDATVIVAECLQPLRQQRHS